MTTARRRRTTTVRITLVLGVLAAGQSVRAASATAQRRVTLDEAIAAAQTSGRRLRIARADSAAAAARLVTARAIMNPTLSLGYSKSPPPYHLEVEQPIAFPWLRKARIDAARFTAAAAALGLDIENARLRYDVETAYAGVFIAQAIAGLSAQNARDGDELVRIAVARRDAGDAAELDVDLARVTAAGLHRAAAIDSLAITTSALELQSLMGMDSAAVVLAAADSFVALPLSAVGASQLRSAPGAALQQADLEARAAELALKAEQGSARFSEISIRAGFETGDPDMRGFLPTIGFAIPLPLFDQRKGPIAEARAERDRSLAVQEQLREQARLGFALAERQRAVQQSVLEQDRAGLEDARRVAARALTAYREGEYTLAAVIEAQRSARDALRQYYEDLGALWAAQSAFTLARTSGLRP
ncbi:MAG: TolC family protein [Longimicrobiales bacterium]